MFCGLSLPSESTPKNISACLDDAKDRCQCWDVTNNINSVTDNRKL